MSKRGAKPLKELYDLTHRISQAEITPVLEGSCRIQGPVDESDHQPLRANSGMSPAEKTYLFVNENLRPRRESGTCNMCSAPCSSCMHISRTASFEESNIERLFPGNTSGRKEDGTISFIGADGLPLYKRRTHDGNQLAASEASNLLSTSSSHDSYSENAQSKATCRASITYEASDAVDMPTKLSSSADVGKECHGDNLSCISAVLDRIADVDKKDATCSSASTSEVLGKEIEDKVQVKAAHVAHNHKNEENHADSKTPSIHDKESSEKRRTSPNSGKIGIFDQPDLAEFPPSKTTSLDVQSLCFNSLKRDTKDLEGNSCSHIQAEPFECLMENLKPSTRGPLKAGCVNKVGSIKSGNPSAALKHPNSCLEIDTQLDCMFSSDEATKNEQFENSNACMETSNLHVPEVQTKPNMEGEHSQSDSLLVDVKVCDTCGDAGREDSLAICSRCSDGAEHTYCMRKKLDKLPEGEWLCEECKTKDTEFLKAEKSDPVSGASNSIACNDQSQHLLGTFNCKLLPRLNTKMIDQEARGDTKGLKSPEVLSTRHAGNLADRPFISKKTSEANSGPVGPASHRKKPGLFHESSPKILDMGKVKPVSTGPLLGSQSANNSPTYSRLQTSLGSNSFKIQAKLQSPRVPVSRSYSFNSSISKPNPKVKPLNECDLHKLKVGRESTSTDSRKEGFVRKLTKSASFKSGSSDLSTIEPVGKGQFLIPSPRNKPSGSKKLKERIVLEKKASSVLDRQSIQAGTAISLPKVDLKIGQHDGILQDKSESKSLSIRKVSDDQSDTEVKKQPSFKYFGGQSSKGMWNSLDKKPRRLSKGIIRSKSFANDGSCTSSLKPTPEQKIKEGGERINKREDSGEETNTKIRIQENNRLLEQKIKEGGERINKREDSGEETNTKIRIQENNRLVDQSEDSLSPSAELVCRTTSISILSNSLDCSGGKILSNSLSCPGDLPFLEGKTHGQEITKGSDAGGSKATDADTRQQPTHPVEASHVRMESSIKSLVQIFPDQTSIFTSSSRASVIPMLEFIWQGSFEVTRTGRFPEMFDGFQAHLSNRASSEVPKLASKFPFKVQLEEVPCLKLWLSQFQETSPKEDDIALFFFARDTESYEKNYSKLLQNMLKNDLALRGNIEGVELLIFTSTTLPANCQRWNSLLFLWGVFGGRRMSCLEELPGSQKKLCRPTLCKDSLVQNLPLPLINVVSNSQKIDSMGNKDMELSCCDRSSKAKAIITTTSVDCGPLLSCRVDNQTCDTEVSPLAGNSLYQPAAECKLSSDPTTFPINCSLVHMKESVTLLDLCPETRLKSIDKVLCQEGNISGAYLKNLVTASTREVDEEIERSRFRSPTTDPDSLNCSQGTDAEVGQSAEKAREKNKSMIIEAVSETQTNRKRTHWFPTEIVNLDEETKPKKMKSFLYDQKTVPTGNSEVIERCLFPLDLGPMWHFKPNNIIHIHSDDEDLPESDAPFLELALGRKKRTDKQKPSPLPGPEVDDDTSLSLSLGFPPL